MKEATGVARITRTGRAMSRPAQGEAQAAAAKIAPSRVPAPMPARMRPRDTSTVCQNSPVCPRRMRARATVAG